MGGKGYQGAKVQKTFFAVKWKFLLYCCIVVLLAFH